jgi:2-hydroxy-3-keto-5-methylthiopentenyl-1-phosphate phosphatase
VKNALVSDFDGTITRRDFYLLIRERYMAESAPDYFELYRAGQLSHFEAMAAYFAYAPDKEAALQEMIARTEPDPCFVPAVSTLQAASWDLIIVSAGSLWYIERILRDLGVEAVVHSNPGHIRKGQGLVIERPSGTPFFSAEVGVDKAAVVQDALGRYEQVAFAGDGPPDLEPALLVSPRFRFARGYLADALQRRREPFQEFRSWSEIARCLVQGRSADQSPNS